MPLIHSTSKKAFGENIARERAAGKPEAQAVAIAYATKRDAEHHSSHSAARSKKYHSEVVKSNSVDRGPTKMTKLKQPRERLDTGKW